MTENGTPLDRAETRMAKADAAIDAKALGALAADMASIPSHAVPPCSCENRDAALGLPLVMVGSDATDRLKELTDGRTPGTTTPSRTDAASFSDKMKRDAERIALIVAAHSAVYVANSLANKLSDGKAWGHDSLTSAAAWLSRSAASLEAAMIAFEEGGAE